MPKSPTRSTENSKAQEDEARILEAVKQRPDILDTLNHITRNRKKQQSTWDDLAAEFDSTTEVLKKVWLKARQSVEMKKDKEAVRPRSARSSLAEPTRRSLRCQSIDKTISIASTTVLCCDMQRLTQHLERPESTDNSCATSSCGGSPRASRRNLEPINETDDLKPAKQEHEEEPEAKKPTEEDEVVQPQKPEENSEPAAAYVTASTSSNLARYLETTLPAENKQNRPSRFSEPTQTPKNSHNVNNPPRRTNLGNKNLKINKPLTVNPEDPTRVFFESMGLTVMAFPQYLQASVKVQVSNIVHELEYDLSLPGNAQVDKSVAVMAS